MNQKYTELENKEVVIKCDRYKEGKVVIIKRDRWGAYFQEDWQKSHLVNEDNVKLYLLTPVE